MKLEIRQDGWRSSEGFFLTLLILFVVSIVIANVVGARVITTGVSVFGIELATSGGAITYAVTFLCTDIIGEIWGKRTAMSVVKYGFIGQLFALICIVMTGWLPPTDAGMDAAYRTLLGQNWSFVCGSLCAYYAAQTWDVWVFHRLREIYCEVKKKMNPDFEYCGQGRWIWNNLSTWTSQIFDTVIYASISFGIGMGWFFDRTMWGAWLGLCIGQYVLKLCLAILDTPFFYFLTKTKKEN